MPWRVGLIAAAATSSRREAPWPEPNTGLVILTSLVLFAQVESIGLSKVVTQSRLDELVEQCLCCVREERIYGAFPDAHKQGNIYCGLRYTEYVIPFFLSSPFLLLFFLKNKLWYYTNLVK